VKKKVNKRKKQNKIIKSLQNCLKEYNITLKKKTETAEYIVLDSHTALIGVMDLYVIVTIQKIAKKVVITIARPKMIPKAHLEPLIEFANMINKIYSTVGCLTVDTNNGFMDMRFAVDLIDERLDTNHLKICLTSILLQIEHLFCFVEKAKIENSTFQDLLKQYEGYCKAQRAGEIW
jgi:hypothetical protein